MPYPDGYPRRFTLFHAQNEWLYESMVEHALQLRARGFRRLSIRYLYEHQRFGVTAKVKDAHRALEYGLDNNYTASYARLIMEKESELKGIFRTRSAPIDEANPDQAAMEFD